MRILKIYFMSLWTVLVATSLSVAVSAQELQRPDLLSFAQGALPIAITQGKDNLRADMEHAISLIDGSPKGFVATRKPAQNGDSVEFLYQLPALTKFDGFSVPNIKETPSPSQTFFKNIEVSGSAEGPDGQFSLLAKAELATHSEDGEQTSLTMAGNLPEVKWVRVRLEGGIDIHTDKTFLEFSELIGTGSQQDVDLSNGFSGIWSGRGVKLELEQEGATVSGCYDNNSLLTGTVEGNILRALGKDEVGVISQFILIAAPNGAIRGLRSTNGAPFKPYDGDISNKAPECLPPDPPQLGCGSIVHGIQFDFDSDVIRPSSEVIISNLFEGLSQSGNANIQIIGHSSSEGAEDYNRDLSQRRAQSVVKALIALGLNENGISASGRGEDEPIASNDDEAGRSLNRRVEIQCTG